MLDASGASNYVQKITLRHMLTVYFTVESSIFQRLDAFFSSKNQFS